MKNFKSFYIKPQKICGCNKPTLQQAPERHIHDVCLCGNCFDLLTTYHIKYLN